MLFGTGKIFRNFLGGHWCFLHLIHPTMASTKKYVNGPYKEFFNFHFFTDSCYDGAIFSQGLLRTLIKQIIISGAIAIMTIKS